MVKTRTIKYESQEQVFNEIVEQLRKSRAYQPDFLIRCFPAAGLSALRKQGNDRVHTYTPQEIKYGKARYQECERAGESPDDIDWETFNIMEEYNLNPEDFIFASTETKTREWLDDGIGDNALMRLSKNLDPTSVSIWNPAKFLGLPWHGFEFRDKSLKGKKSALVRVFKIQDMERLERLTA